MSIVLNGTTQGASVAQAIVTEPPFTMAGWFSPSGVAVLDTILSVGDTGTSYTNYNMMIDGAYVGPPADVLRAHLRHPSGDTNIYGTGSFVASVWQHALMTMSASKLVSIYLNGGSMGSGTVTNVPSAALLDATGIGFAIRSVNGYFFGGNLAELAIWNSVLSAAVIANAAAGVYPNQLSVASLQMYQPCLAALNEASKVGPDFTGVASPTFSSGVHPTMIDLPGDDDIGKFMRHRMRPGVAA